LSHGLLVRISQSFLIGVRLPSAGGNRPALAGGVALAGATVGPQLHKRPINAILGASRDSPEAPLERRLAKTR